MAEVMAEVMAEAMASSFSFLTGALKNGVASTSAGHCRGNTLGRH